MKNIIFFPFRHKHTSSPIEFNNITSNTRDERKSQDNKMEIAHASTHDSLCRNNEIGFFLFSRQVSVYVVLPRQKMIKTKTFGSLE